MAIVPSLAGVGFCLFIAHTIREIFGGKRSAAGVHGSSGRILPQGVGLVVTAGIALVATIIAAELVAILMASAGPALALLSAGILAYYTIGQQNYVR